MIINLIMFLISNQYCQSQNKFQGKKNIQKYNTQTWNYHFVWKILQFLLQETNNILIDV